MSRRSVYYKPNLAEKQAIRAALAKSTASRARAETISAMRAALAANPPRAPTNSSRAASIATRRVSTNAPEMKHVDHAEDTILLNNTTPESFVLLNGVATGTNNYNRNGNKISPVSVDIDFFVTNNTVLATQPVRVALIWDKQPKTDGTFPTSSDIWADVESDGQQYTSPFSGRNYTTTDRFVCLASEEVFLLANQNNSAGRHTLSRRWIRSLRGLPCQFKATTASLGSISTGALYMVVYGNYLALSATNTINVYYDVRFKFLDP